MSLIQSKISLLGYNTLAVDVHAKYFAEVFSIDQLGLLLQDPLRDKLDKKLILGGGSNILLREDFPGLVIKNSILGRTVVDETDTEVLVRVGAGEVWHDFVERSVDHGYGGIENLSFIPGCVGASPMQNIGAYGMEVKETIDSVEYIDIESGTTKNLSAEECEFSYRDSVFKHALKDSVIIVSVVFRLQKIDTDYVFRLEYDDIHKYLSDGSMDISGLTLRDVADMIRVIRSRKLPDRTKLGTAGSFFKNPYVDLDTRGSLKEQYPFLLGFLDGSRVKLSAGQLIEKSGLKGKQWGLVGTYQKHALVLVNHGGTGKDIVRVAQEIQEIVFARFGVVLEPEVNYV